MCVKHVPGSRISNKHLDYHLFTRAKSVFAQLEALVLNGIGEPLLHPEIVTMVEFARATMPASGWIGFQTNGMLLNRDNIESLLDAGLNRLCISVDSPASCSTACSLLVHEQTPQHSSPVALADTIRKEKKHSDFLLGAEIVLLKSTLPQLPALVEQLAREGVDYIIGSHLLAYLQEAENESLFDSCTTEAREMYRKWQIRAEAEGLNLVDLTAKTWIAPRKQQEHRLQQLYREMLKDAQLNNIWLNVKKLSEWDEEATERDRQYLKQAEDIARKYGIELSLPPLSATSERSCSFIESDALFVDADGSIMPCHPLWHSHTLYMDGEAKHINHKTFGNLAHHDLLQTWQSAEYQEFRRAVLRYDYPFCHNCSVGPCPDITGESTPFENDCFGIPVPCGHCLWCFDAVRCL
jgi:putative metalloenzyme radical SAM/SPASM domain maturase